MPKGLKETAQLILYLAIVVTISMTASSFLTVEILNAAEAKRSTVLCDGCTGTGAQREKQVDGGLSVAQATCLTTGGNTFPDAIDLEARDSSDHTFATVEGFTTMTADGRQADLLGFAASSFVRIVITDAAGQHDCYFTLASIGK